jgi:O-antigen/teichoic acid export membrane protein
MYAIYPLLTRVEGHGGNPARIGGLVLRLVAWIVVPVAIVFSVLAAPVVQVVYGAQWTAVTPLLPWAMGWGALAAVVHAAYMLLLARQQARLCFWADLAVLAGTGLALWLVLPVGTEAYLISLVAVQAVVVSALLATLTRFAAVTWRGLFEAFFPPVLAGALAWGALLVVQGGLGWGNPAKFGPALAWGLAFGLLYLLVLRLGFKDQLSELVKYFPARREIAASLRLSIG